jgi:hypothetical protein
MRTIPNTPSKLTGDVLEACHRRYLDGSDLAAWAEALLTAGFDSDAITRALASPDLHWQDVPALFTAMCRDVGLSQGIMAEVAVLKQEVMTEEYRRGQREGTELLHRFDDLRKDVGFPEQLMMRLLEDNDDGTNDSGYYGMDSRQHGQALESLVREYLAKAGIRT